MQKVQFACITQAGLLFKDKPKTDGLGSYQPLVLENLHPFLTGISSTAQVRSGASVSRRSCLDMFVLSDVAIHRHYVVLGRQFGYAVCLLALECERFHDSSTHGYYHDVSESRQFFSSIALTY